MVIRYASKLVTAIIVTELAGVIGSLFTMPAIPNWYAGIMKPAISPPNWVFGPVWTTLFLLMGVAAFLVWKRGWEQREVRIALGAFGVQLALNVLWSVIFFGLRNPLLALIEILVLWCAIVGTIVVFARVSKAAAWLLAPYIAWVSFAVYLNAAIWKLN